MTKQLDVFHKLILDFLEKNNWWKEISLRKMAELIKLSHPQKVLNKIHQLERMWYIRKNHEQGGYDIFRDTPIPEFMTVPLYSSEQFFHKKFSIGITPPLRMIKVPSDILWLTGNEQYFFVKVQWKSLLPRVHPDDLVLIKQEKQFIEWKKYVIIYNNTLENGTLQKIWARLSLISGNYQEPLLIKKNVKILWEAKRAIISL